MIRSLTARRSVPNVQNGHHLFVGALMKQPQLTLTNTAGQTQTLPLTEGQFELGTANPLLTLDAAKMLPRHAILSFDSKGVRLTALGAVLREGQEWETMGQTFQLESTESVQLGDVRISIESGYVAAAAATAPGAVLHEEAHLPLQASSADDQLSVPLISGPTSVPPGPVSAAGSVDGGSSPNRKGLWVALGAAGLVTLALGALGFTKMSEQGTKERIVAASAPSSEVVDAAKRPEQFPDEPLASRTATEPSPLPTKVTPAPTEDASPPEQSAAISFTSPSADLPTKPASPSKTPVQIAEECRQSLQMGKPMPPYGNVISKKPIILAPFSPIETEKLVSACPFMKGLLSIDPAYPPVLSFSKLRNARQDLDVLVVRDTGPMACTAYGCTAFLFVDGGQGYVEKGRYAAFHEMGAVLRNAEPHLVIWTIFYDGSAAAAPRGEEIAFRVIRSGNQIEIEKRVVQLHTESFERAAPETSEGQETTTAIEPEKKQPSSHAASEESEGATQGGEASKKDEGNKKDEGTKTNESAKKDGGTKKDEASKGKEQQAPEAAAVEKKKKKKSSK